MTWKKLTSVKIVKGQTASRRDRQWELVAYDKRTTCGAFNYIDRLFAKVAFYMNPRNNGFPELVLLLLLKYVSVQFDNVKITSNETSRLLDRMRDI